jgi:ethanolamine ammonia-lyase small subunit
MSDDPADRATPAHPPGENFWDGLRQLTAARIGLARSGASLATMPLLEFRLAHSRARDAVNEPLDVAQLSSALAGLSDPVLAVASAAETRPDYLLRPDLGRRLAAGADAALIPHAGRHDVVFVIADGLSARAVQMHAPPVLGRVIETLRARQTQGSETQESETRDARTQDLRIAPLVIVRHGRVAIGDAVAAALGAECVVMVIGERPGLSAADSMGAYLTFQPHAGTSDADRNCISNIRPEGLGYADAAYKIVAMLGAMRAARLSGVRLKDDTGRLIDGAAG